MKDPAFLFYSSDFLNGVVDLTMEERGQYITLLCLNHQKGELTEKTIRLSVGSVSVDVLSKFSKKENGNFFNARLDEEIEKRKLFTESRRNNGLKGGRPRKNKKPLGFAKDNLMEDENENVNEDNNEIENKEKKKIFNFKNSLIEYGFEEKLVDEWMAVKKNKKATNTETSFKKFISQIELAPEDKNEILKLVIEKDWRGFEYQWLVNLQNEFKKTIQPQQKMYGRLTEETMIKNGDMTGIINPYAIKNE